MWPSKASPDNIAPCLLVVDLVRISNLLITTYLLPLLVLQIVGPITTFRLRLCRLHIVLEAFKLLVQLSLLFSVQRPMLFSLPLCLIVVYVVQKSYLQTSRQLRYIDLESRSALFSSFLETVNTSPYLWFIVSG